MDIPTTPTSHIQQLSEEDIENMPPEMRAQFILNQERTEKMMAVFDAMPDLSLSEAAGILMNMVGNLAMRFGRQGGVAAARRYIADTKGLLDGLDGMIVLAFCDESAPGADPSLPN